MWLDGWMASGPRHYPLTTRRRHLIAKHQWRGAQAGAVAGRLRIGCLRVGLDRGNCYDDFPAFRAYFWIRRWKLLRRFSGFCELPRGTVGDSFLVWGIFWLLGMISWSGAHFWGTRSDGTWNQKPNVAILNIFNV